MRVSFVLSVSTSAAGPFALSAAGRARPGAADPSIYLGALTVTLKDAVPVLALESVAVQSTRVRPIRNRLPDRGTHVLGTWPSTASVALTVYVTRARLAPRRATTVFDFVPVNPGGATSNSKRGATIVPVNVSVPRPEVTERVNEPLPDAPS